MLVNLAGEEAREVAKILSSETGKKILDFMSVKESVTETEVADSLNLPLSTVHYNMQQLLKAKLVVADEYHYSKRGKEILHYKLAKKYIIIAPQGESKKSFFEHLKKYIPVTLIAISISVIIKMISFFYAKTGTFKATSVIMEDVTQVANKMLREAPNQQILQTTPEVVKTPTYSLGLPEYFLIGAIVVILIMIFIEYFRWRKDKENKFN